LKLKLGKKTMRNTVALVALFLVASQASASISLNRILSKNVGNVPLEINVCADSPGQNLQNFQAFTDGPPVKGFSMGLHLDATAIADISTKTARVICLLDGTTLYSSDNDFTKTLAAGDNLHWDFSYYLPSIIPNGTYTLRIEFVSLDKVVEGCGEFPLTFA